MGNYICSKRKKRKTISPNHSVGEDSIHSHGQSLDVKKLCLINVSESEVNNPNTPRNSSQDTSEDMMPVGIKKEVSKSIALKQLETQENVEKDGMPTTYIIMQGDKVIVRNDVVVVQEQLQTQENLEMDEFVPNKCMIQGNIMNAGSKNIALKKPETQEYVKIDGILTKDDNIPGDIMSKASKSIALENVETQENVEMDGILTKDDNIQEDIMNKAGKSIAPGNFETQENLESGGFPTKEDVWPEEIAMVVCDISVYSKSLKAADEIPNCVIPAPLRNPRGYCFLNCVTQVLRGCLDFTRAIIEHIKSDNIVSTVSTDGDVLFANSYGKLILEMKNLSHKAGVEGIKYSNKDYHTSRNAFDNSLYEVQKHFQEYEDGDDIQKCFLNVLTKIKNATFTFTNTEFNTPVKFSQALLNLPNKNTGFIFDLFYGQMRNSIICKNCSFIKNENFQLFKCLPLPVISSVGTIDILQCIHSLLQPSDIMMEEKMTCACPDGSMDFTSHCQITHSPQYLFIYLSRGSRNVNGSKNTDFVKFGSELNVPTMFGEIPYMLISVIDHVGNSEGGHYFCKCNYEGDNWWYISDTEVVRLGPDFHSIPSKQTMGLMFKKRI